MDIEKYNMLQRNYTKKNKKLNLVSLLIISIIVVIPQLIVCGTFKKLQIAAFN